MMQESATFVAVSVERSLVQVELSFEYSIVVVPPRAFVVALLESAYGFAA